MAGDDVSDMKFDDRPDIEGAALPDGTAVPVLLRLRSGGRVIGQAAESLASRMSDPRVRRELGWIIVNQAMGFALSFLLLKVMTWRMSESAFGQYNLMLAAGILLANVLVMPAVQGYLRYLHKAEVEGKGWAAGRTVLKWHLAATTSVLAFTIVFTLPLGRWFHLEPWLVLAGGLFFFANRWRSLWVEILEVLRERKTLTFYYSGNLLVQCAIIALVVRVRPTATSCLLASALASLVFLWPGVPAMVRRVLSQPRGQGSEMGKMIAAFGMPYSVLLVFQWIQMYSDRYVVGFVMDLDSVGIYVAAYQVCGIPFTLLLAFLNTLLIPVAYQRCRDATVPAEVWSADKVLIGGLGVYLLAGAVFVVVYWLWGTGLVPLLTSKRFAAPAGTVLVLTIGRYVANLALVLQMFFAVHQKMAASLWFRLAGALLTIPLCWMFARWMGLFGAALGVALAAGLYIALLSLGPEGCVWMIWRNYRRLAAARNTESVST